MSRIAIAQQMRGVELKPGTRAKRVGHNTVRYVAPNDDIVYRLYMTDIVRIGHDDAGRQVVTLRTNGWNTPTTFDRINRFGPGPWRITSDHGEPMIGSWRDGFQPFEDGMQIIDGRLPPCHDNPWLRREVTKLSRRTLNYIDKVMVFTPSDSVRRTFQQPEFILQQLWSERYAWGPWSGSIHLPFEIAGSYVLKHANIPVEWQDRWHAIQRLGGISPTLRAKLRKRVREALVRLFDGFQP